MKNPSYSPTPKIHFTKSGSEFFLSWNERQNPKTGETKEVHFAVIHRICGLGEIDAAIQLLYEAACAADLPWEVFVAALSYAESRPARRVPGSPRIARLGNKNELYKAMRQEVVEEWVQLPPGVNIGRYIRNQIEAIVRSAGPWDKQFVFAQFRGEAIMKPIEIVAGFAEEAEDLTNRFGPIEDEATLDRYIDELLDTALARNVALDPFIGSRAIDGALENVFQFVLGEIRTQAPEEWERLTEESHRLHDLFYRIRKHGTGGALVIYPTLNEAGTDIKFLSPGPVQFATEQFRSPAPEELLDIAAFEPDRLPKTFHRIAAAAVFEKHMVGLYSQAESDALYHKNRVYLGDGEPDPIDFTPVKGSRDEFLQFFKNECGLDDREAEVLYDRFHGYAGDDLAAQYGVTKGRISQIKKKAEQKVHDACAADVSILRRLYWLSGQHFAGPKQRAPLREVG